MMREVYSELKRGPEVPIATFEQAFLPHNFFTMQQQFRGEWHAWDLPLPFNTGKPGEGGDFPAPWDYALEALEVLWNVWKNHRLELSLAGRIAAIPAALAEAAIFRSIVFTLDEARRLLTAIRNKDELPELAGKLLAGLLKFALGLIRAQLEARFTRISRPTGPGSRSTRSAPCWSESSPTTSSARAPTRSTTSTSSTG